MITYAERACFGRQHLEALLRAEACVRGVSALWGNELRCHELARAVHARLAVPKLFVVDGKCGVVEHSWITFSDGVILDPYVPGRLPAVQLVDPIVGMTYRSGLERSDIKMEIVARLISEMATTTAAPPRPARR